MEAQGADSRDQVADTPVGNVHQHDVLLDRAAQRPRAVLVGQVGQRVQLIGVQTAAQDGDAD